MRRITIIFCFLLALATAAAGQDQTPLWKGVCMQQGASNCGPVTVATGDVIYFFASAESSTPTPTDSKSTSYSLVSSATVGGARAYLWCGTISSGGSDTYTLTGGSFDSFMVVDYPAGTPYGCTTDGTTQTGQAASGTVTTTSLTPTRMNDLTFCFFTDFHNGSHPQTDHSNGWMDAGVNNGSDSRGLAGKYTGQSLSAYSCTFIGNDDSNGNYILVAFKASALTIMTSTLPDAIQSKAYKYCLEGVGGVGSYTFSVSSGSLPAGLSITSNCIQGTPTGSTSTFTLQLSDGTSTTTQSLTLNVRSTENTVAVHTQTTSGSTFGVNISSGDCIFVSQTLPNPTYLYPPSDTLGTVFKMLGTRYRSGVLYGEVVYRGLATSSGADTITYTGGGQNFAVAFSNSQCFGDGGASSDGNNAAGAITGPSVTTVSPDSEVWGAISFNNASLSAATGWTIDATASHSGGVHAFESTAGSYTPTGTSDNTSDWVFWGAMLRPSGSGTAVSGTIKFKSRLY